MTTSTKNYMFFPIQTNGILTPEKFIQRRGFKKISSARKWAIDYLNDLEDTYPKRFKHILITECIHRERVALPFKLED